MTKREIRACRWVAGTGKTMLARAIAHDSGAAMLNIRMSSLANKYYGSRPSVSNGGTHIRGDTF